MKGLGDGVVSKLPHFYYSASDVDFGFIFLRVSKISAITLFCFKRLLPTISLARATAAQKIGLLNRSSIIFIRTLLIYVVLELVPIPSLFATAS